ncbi:unnamed protein product [Effrenium voratum]|nr:unnamed protein product [Effrenium voratum]
MDLEEEDGESPPTLEIYWTEALGRVQFLLLASNEVPEERVSTSLRANVATLDAFCPGLLQMMAVLQMPPPSVSAYTSAAKIHLDSPILDLETWQPESPFKSEVEEKALAEAAAEMVRSAHCAALEPPAGTAPKTLRARQGLGCSPGAPRMPAQSSAWNGEVVDTGLQPPTGGLGDIGDVLQLAQGLCRTKGSELAGAYALLKDGHRLLQQLNENVALAAGSELSQSLAEATRSANEAQAQLEERKSQHQELRKQLTALLDQVVNNCAQQSNKVEAAEQLLLQTRQEIEANRFQLINFGKQESTRR